ncbi:MULTISPECIES: hypothetical protein [unclassified Streptomyces]|uniref:hypothetical protein n=1 Tax=unclassified Streptomyces TaxID=2593676 RepID=UPI00340A21B7
MTKTTRELLAHVLERVSSRPEEWTVRDTQTITRLRAAAEWEEASEKVAAVRTRTGVAA